MDTSDQKSHRNWEDVCKKCGRCCYEKVEFEGEVYYTELPCQFLDLKTRRCTVYQQRETARPGCVHLNDDNIKKGFLPPDCPYVVGIDDYPEPHMQDDITDKSED